jgi:hypothetical protein
MRYLRGAFLDATRIIVLCPARPDRRHGCRIKSGMTAVGWMPGQARHDSIGSAVSRPAITAARSIWQAASPNSSCSTRRAALHEEAQVQFVGDADAAVHLHAFLNRSVRR